MRTRPAYGLLPGAPGVGGLVTAAPLSVRDFAEAPKDRDHGECRDREESNEGEEPNGSLESEGRGCRFDGAVFVCVHCCSSHMLACRAALLGQQVESGSRNRSESGVSAEFEATALENDGRQR